MKKTKIIPISKLLKKALITSKDFRKNGHSPSLLHYYEKKDLIKRVGRGLYINVKKPPHIKFKWEDLVYSVLSIPNGVITGVSALDIYELTDEIPREYWVAVPHSTSLGFRPTTRIIHTRNHDLGLSSIKLGGVPVPIYEIERVLIDAFKLTDRETAVKALKSAFKSGKRRININKLVDYSKKLRTNIRPYLEVVTTT